MPRLIVPAPAELAALIRYFHAESAVSGALTLPASPYPTLGVLLSGGTRLDIAGQPPGLPTPRLFVVGVVTAPATLHVDHGTRFVSAVLHAGALPGFFDDDASRLTNRVCDLGQYWPDAVRSRMLDSMTPDLALDAAVAVLAVSLAGLVRSPVPPLQIAETAWDAPPGELAATVGVGLRQFQRLVLRHYGVPMRMLRRYARYVPALRAMMDGLGAATSLADLAAQAGFFDQAHMAHDFRKLAGLTPLELHRGLRASTAAADPLHFVRYRKHERQLIAGGLVDTGHHASGEMVARQGQKGER